MDSSSNLSADYLDLLPDETLLKILLEVDDLTTLFSLCRTSKRINLICQDKLFWKQKYQKDFGETTLIEGETWGGRYKRMAQFGINSPISAGNRVYGVIDQTGNLYMSGWKDILGIGPQPRMGFKSRRQHLVKFPSKVISISTRSHLAGAVTRDGKAYIWGYDRRESRGRPWRESLYRMPGHVGLTRKPREIILPNDKKAIRIEVSWLGHIILLEDSSVYLHLDKSDQMFFQGILNVEAIDVSIGPYLYAIITKGDEVRVGGLSIYGLNLSDYSATISLKFPESARSVIATLHSIVVLSITGKVYKWDYKWDHREIKFRNTRPKLVELPEPIVQISIGGKTFAALSKTGKLYMWGSNVKDKISSDNQSFRMIGQTQSAPSPVEISFGLPINFVSVGFNFTIAVSNDGIVNYWGDPMWAPE